MQLFKKIGFYVFIVTSLSLAIWGYFRLKENKEPTSMLIEHITRDAAVVIETKTLSELINQITRQNLIWNGLQHDPSIKQTQCYLHYLDSICAINTDISEVLTNNAVFLAFIKEGNELQSLILFKAKEKSNETFFIEFFDKNFKKLSETNDADSYEFTLSNQKWLTTYKNGIVYISTSSNLLKQSLNLPIKESLSADAYYNSLIKENGSQNNQVYVNQHQLNLFNKSLFANQSLYSTEVKLDEITFNGYIISDSLTDVIKHQEPNTIDIYQQLPRNPSTVMGFAISDANLYAKEFKKTGTDEENNEQIEAWKSLNDTVLYDMHAEFLQNIDGQIVANTYRINDNSSVISAFKIKDIDKISVLLNNIKDSVIKQNEEAVYHLNTNYSCLLAYVSHAHRFKYAYVANDLLLCFSDRAALQLYTQSRLSSDFISKDNAFMRYATDNFSQDANMIWYNNLDVFVFDKDPSIIQPSVLLALDKAISKVSVTAKNYKNMLQVRVNAIHQQQSRELGVNTSSYLWAFDADSAITSSINVFTNHITQENELCFQDNAKQLYLITATGNLIWKKKLCEVIKSPIYTVDIFKNGKLQLLFNTDNYLHLLDRNGNYVQGYPVKLPSKSTSAITLLDYDNTKDYRIFIACADKRIYNFSLYGIKTEGYNPLKTDAIVELPLFYCKVGQSDYLITADVMGKIYAFSRKGEGRIDFENKTITHLSNVYVLSGNTLDNSKIIYVDDKNNLLNKITLTDKKEALKLGDELSGFKTNFDVINDDDQYDVFAFGDGALYGYDLFSSKLIEYFSTSAVYHHVQSISTSSHQYIVAFDYIGQKVDVLNIEGKLTTSISHVSKQPLVTNLYKNGKTYLVITNQHQVFCQELD